jgi:hypothetical protein
MVVKRRYMSIRSIRSDLWSEPIGMLVAFCANLGRSLRGLKSLFVGESGNSNSPPVRTIERGRVPVAQPVTRRELAGPTRDPGENVRGAVVRASEQEVQA